MLNPFLASDNTTETETDNLPILREFAWDFIHDCFIFNTDGSHKIVEKNEALKVWIYKALKTERYMHEAYKHSIYNNECSFGVELEKFIGKRKNDITTATEIIRYIQECLETNPYILKINSINIDDIAGDKLTISISLSSVYAELTQEVSI